MAGMIRFGVLGPLRVDRDGVAVPGLNAFMLRRLLAALLARPGGLVPIDELFVALWGADVPQSARKTLQVYVRRLRVALRDERLIGHEVGGYRLNTDAAQVDSMEFAELVASAQAAGPEVRAARLRQALGLWRGSAFEDVRDHAPILDEARRLDEERLRVEVACGEIELALGRHERLIPSLLRLTGENPFREDLRSQLMIALYRANRQSEALAVFRETQRLLREELGISPGQEFDRLHRLILRGSPELDLVVQTGQVPRELPAEVGGFVGRVQEQRLLDEALLGSAQPRVCVVSGTAGVGKTALAVRWAWQVAERFPDGQIYLNLNGFSSSAPVRPIEALAAMLRALGVASDKVPAHEAEAAPLFRSTVAERQLIIVLDNARSADQIRPLLPGGASATLITSRNNLSGLIAYEGITRVELDVLGADEACNLVTALIGPQRAQDQAGVEDLARMCAYLPLALRIAGANLKDRPYRTISDYVVDLSANRLPALTTDDGDEQAALRVAFDLSCQGLPTLALRTFRLLGVIPGRDFTTEAVAALADMSTSQAASQLAALSNAHLVEHVGPERYSFHDLLRIYAQELAAEDEEALSARRRYFSWYLARVESAVKLLFPNIIRLPVPPPESPTDGGFVETEACWQWLDAECGNLVAAIKEAAEHGPHEFSWLLASSARGYFARRRHVIDWLQAAQVALAAASESGDRAAMAVTHLSVAHALHAQFLFEPMIEHLHEAIKLAEILPWPQLKAVCTGNLGSFYFEVGAMADAAAMARESLKLSREIGYKSSEQQALGNLGYVLTRTGQLAEATKVLSEAVDICRETKNDLTLAIDLARLADAVRLSGNFALAARLVAEALESGLGRSLAHTTGLVGLANLLLDVRQPSRARSVAEQALATAGRFGEGNLQSRALLAVGLAHGQAGDHAAALSWCHESLTLAGAQRSLYVESEAELGIALTQHRLGRDDEAFEQAKVVLSRARAHSFEIVAGQALGLLGSIQLGRSACDSGDYLHAALDSHRRTGYQLGEADALELLAQINMEGQAAQAHRAAAKRIFDDLMSGVAEELGHLRDAICDGAM